MDPWKYALVADGSSDLHTPLGRDKLTRLTQALKLSDRQHVVDIGCGTGWMLNEWAGFWLLDATGLDANPRLIERAYARGAAGRAPVRWEVLADKGWTVPEASHSVVICLGATDLLGGYAETVAWSAAALHPGGQLAVGAGYRGAGSEDPGDDGSQVLRLTEQVDLLEAAGFEITALLEASTDDWDRLHSSRWTAVANWLEENPDDADAGEIAAECARRRREYLERRPHPSWAALVARRVTGDVGTVGPPLAEARADDEPQTPTLASGPPSTVPRI